MQTKIAIRRSEGLEKLHAFLRQEGYQVWQLQKENRRILLFAKRKEGFVFGISNSAGSGIYDVGILCHRPKSGSDMVLLCGFFLPKRITKWRLEGLAVYLQGERLQPESTAISTECPNDTVWDFANLYGYGVRRI